MVAGLPRGGQDSEKLSGNETRTRGGHSHVHHSHFGLDPVQ